MSAMGRKQTWTSGDLSLRTSALRRPGVPPNVVLCGGQTALTTDMVLRSRPVRSSYELGRSLKKRRACRSDLLNVSVIRPTAATHDVEVRETFLELSVLGAELNRVPNV